MLDLLVVAEDSILGTSTMDRKIDTYFNINRPFTTCAGALVVAACRLAACAFFLAKSFDTVRKHFVVVRFWIFSSTLPLPNFEEKTTMR